jgi:hypothetical protein
MAAATNLKLLLVVVARYLFIFLSVSLSFTAVSFLQDRRKLSMMPLSKNQGLIMTRVLMRHRRTLCRAHFDSRGKLPYRRDGHGMGKVTKPPAKKRPFPHDEASVTASSYQKGSYPFSSPSEPSARYHDEQTQQSIVQLRHSVTERKTYHHQNF